MSENVENNPFSRPKAPKRAWYVLRAISGKEAKVKELLDGAIKNTDLGNHVFQVLIPTEKVLDFLKGRGKDAKPEPLRESEVMRMLGTADEINEKLDEDIVNDYMVGETVKVNAGAFSGFNGKITEVFPDKKKLKVMVRIFGRETPLELENSQVERE